MISRHVSLTICAAALCATAGCTFFSNLPLPLALVRSPVTFDTKSIRGSINGPLAAEDACRIGLIAGDILHNIPRNKSIGNRWEDGKPCTRNGSVARIDQIDTLEDLKRQDVLVLIGISGGGSRAAALAAHTLNLLEEAFNRLQDKLEIEKPAHLISLMDVLSTVSGGSLYAYQLGRSKTFLDVAKRATEHLTRQASNTKTTNCREVYEAPSSESQLARNLEAWERCFFFHLAGYQMARSVGILGAGWYVSPGNLFMGPVLTLTTDLNYLDVLSGGLHLTGRSVPNDLGEYFLRKVGKTINLSSTDDKERFNRIAGIGSVLDLYNPYRLKVGDLSPQPRIFFNTTALENGLPFVITQRITHLSSDVTSLRTARLDTVTPHLKPLSHAYTLEEINSSPSTFSLAQAAMASAAFPLGLEPLEVAKYGFRDGYEEMYRTEDKLHLTDGGVFDNSGLSSLSDLVLYLKTSVKREKSYLATSAQTEESSLPYGIDRSETTTIILVSINADADDYDLAYPRRLADSENWYNRSPISINLPLRTGALGIKALEAIHFTNKRRAEEIAIREVMHLVDLAKSGPGIRLLYFPINLGQLSESDWYKIEDPDKLFSRVRGVPTSFGISGSDELVIEQTANKIISARQTIGWPVGPKCILNANVKHEEQVIYELGEAFAFALIRKANSTWDVNKLDESKKGNVVGKWCDALRRVPPSLQRSPVP